MTNRVVTGSIIDVISCGAEIAVLLWFFDLKADRREVRDSLARRALGLLPLAALLTIYMTPLNAAVSVFSIENLAIQILRMLLHLGPVMFWLYLNKECTPSVAAYLSGIFTAIYLTAQNLRMVMMTYGMITPPQQTGGTGYVMGLVFTAAAELGLAMLTRKLSKPEKIDTIDRQRVIMMSLVLFMGFRDLWGSLLRRQDKLPQRSLYPRPDNPPQDNPPQRSNRPTLGQPTPEVELNKLPQRSTPSLRPKYSAFATSPHAVGAPLLQMRHFYCRCFGTLL